MSSSLIKQAAESVTKISKLYSPDKKMMLFGEFENGFAMCLAKHFGTAKNMTSSTFESLERLKELFPDKQAEKNIKAFQDLGGKYVESLNCTGLTQKSVKFWMNYSKEDTKGSSYVLEKDRKQLFDLLVNNFAFHEAKMVGNSPWKSTTPDDLIKPFLTSAVQILDPHGCIDLRLNTGQGWADWIRRVELIAKNLKLEVILDEPFDAHDFPGYRPLRGYGPTYTGEFPLNLPRFLRLAFIDQPTHD